VLTCNDCREPDRLARVTVKGKVFVVHYEVLIRNSTYWHDMLEEPIHQTSMEYWDIEPDHFQSYVSLIYSIFFQGGNTIKLTREILPRRRWIPDLVKLWGLAHRFRHEAVMQLTIHAVDETLEFCEAGHWWDGTSIQKNTRVGNYVEGFQACGNRAPFKQKIIHSFCRGCTASLFEDRHDDMPKEFAKAAATRFAELAKTVEDGQPRKKPKLESNAA
jgi:hypothetical protein